MRIPACALVTMLLALTASYPSQLAAPTPQRSRAITITPSAVLADVGERRRQHPEFTASQLAQYATELIKNRGFDYDFDVCDAVPQSYRTKDGLWSVPNQLLLGTGRKVEVEFTVSNPNQGAALCGECDALIPAVQVTKQEILFVADEKQYRVQRPATYVLDEVELVDASMKKVLRTWQLPFQAAPIGISADGTKLYVNFFEQQTPIDDLVLELSADGRTAVRVRVDVGLRDEGTRIDSPPGTDLSFMRFHAGNNTYIVRFVPPCT